MTQQNGTGLARGPAVIVGGVLLAFGLIALTTHNYFPPVTHAFPQGHPGGSDFLGFRVNGWTAWFSAVAGSVVLFGSAQHLFAKFVSFVAGLALGGAALLGLVNGNVLGLAPTNTLTVIGFGAAAAVLLLNIFAPRIGRRSATHAGLGLAVDPATLERTTVTMSPAGAPTATYVNGYEHQIEPVSS